jgi:ligand-binding SRPBCC domain-containing protein
MATIEFETITQAPLAKVWVFYDDVQRSLPALSDPRDQVQIESVDAPPRVGGKLVLHANGPLGRVKWVAVYVEIVPPHAVVFGEEARFVDEQESGPFKTWRHSHEFEAIDSKTTRMIDRITYTVGMGPLGWIADKLLVRPRLRRMFGYRKEKLPTLFRELQT